MIVSMGVAPLVVKLLMKHCIAEKYFTLEEDNTSLVHFNYGYSESDRPVPIAQSNFKETGPSPLMVTYKRKSDVLKLDIPLSAC